MKLSKLKRTFYEDVLSSFTYKKDENKIILRIESSEAPNQFLGPFADPYFFLDKDEERIIRLEFLGVELIKKDRFKRDLMFDGIKVTSKKKKKLKFSALNQVVQFIKRLSNQLDSLLSTYICLRRSK